MDEQRMSKEELDNMIEKIEELEGVDTASYTYRSNMEVPVITVTTHNIIGIDYTGNLLPMEIGVLRFKFKLPRNDPSIYMYGQFGHRFNVANLTRQPRDNFNITPAPYTHATRTGKTSYTCFGNMLSILQQLYTTDIPMFVEMLIEFFSTTTGMSENAAVYFPIARSYTNNMSEELKEVTL